MRRRIYDTVADTDIHARARTQISRNIHDRSFFFNPGRGYYSGIFSIVIASLRERKIL